MEELEINGLSSFVELVHAPLREYQDSSGEQYLYYSCEEVLESVANRINGTRNRILVLVDGPPGSTGKNARYPALPVILRFFSQHDMDFVMDDSGRPDEASVLADWEGLMEVRGMKYKRHDLGFEKGATVLSIS
jgi:hypothetical protein